MKGIFNNLSALEAGKMTAFSSDYIHFRVKTAIIFSLGTIVLGLAISSLLTATAMLCLYWTNVISVGASYIAYGILFFSSMTSLAVTKMSHLGNWLFSKNNKITRFLIRNYFTRTDSLYIQKRYNLRTRQNENFS